MLGIAEELKIVETINKHWLIRNLRTPGQLTVILRYFLVHPTKAYLVV
jgi:hypothetical protein